jgi:hypothetical protein
MSSLFYGLLWQWIDAKTFCAKALHHKLAILFKTP